MITLYDSLKNYCAEHSTAMPNDNICSAIGKRIMAEIKKGGKFIPIEKTPMTIFVNNYPEEVAPIVAQMVETYYADPKIFFKKPGAQNLHAVKYMNFDIEEKNIEAFESILKSSNIDIAQNFILKGKAQYKIPFINPVDLIKLGMKFQSKIFYLRKQENIKKYEQAKAAKLPAEPENKKLEKKVVKRKRIPVDK